jgi:cyanophycinase-like exopeptidase
VTAGRWRRGINGSTEITGGGDVLRLAYQSALARRRALVKLPIVLAVVQRPCPITQHARSRRRLGRLLRVGSIHRIDRLPITPFDRWRHAFMRAASRS